MIDLFDQDELLTQCVKIGLELEVVEMYEKFWGAEPYVSEAKPRSSDAFLAIFEKCLKSDWDSALMTTVVRIFLSCQQVGTAESARRETARAASRTSTVSPEASH